MLDMNTLIMQFNFRKINQEVFCQLDKYYGHLPAHAYIKNTDGLYLWCNVNQAKTLNFKDRRDFCNKSVFDIVDEDNAILVTHNDQEVMTKGIEKTFKESAYFVSGVEMQSISAKKAISDPDGIVMGMIGISIGIPSIRIDSNAAISKIQEMGLSRREAESAFYFSKGKSAKETAMIMQISYRTVEKHIEHIRLKMGLLRRSQLFEFINDIINV